VYGRFPGHCYKGGPKKKSKGEPRNKKRDTIVPRLPLSRGLGYESIRSRFRKKGRGRKETVEEREADNKRRKPKTQKTARRFSRRGNKSDEEEECGGNGNIGNKNVKRGQSKHGAKLKKDSPHPAKGFLKLTPVKKGTAPKR